MDKLNHWIETYYEVIIILIIAFISSIISVLDFFGILNALPWGLSNHIPTITLLFVALTISFLSLAQLKHISLLKELQQKLNNNLAVNMSIALTQVDSSLRKVFAERYLKKMPEIFDDIVKRNSIKFDREEQEEYKYYNRRTLECFPKASFLATSRPASFLWKDKKVLHNQKEFIRQGGRIIRIFFLESIDDLDSQDIQEELETQRKVLDEQCEIGVEVYTVINVHKIRQEYFMVDDKSKIAWIAEYDENQEFKLGEATTNQQKTKKYLTDFGLLRKAAHQYLPRIKQ
jgi:hypothetical protein